MGAWVASNWCACGDIQRDSSSRRGEFLLHPVVALGLELQGERLVAALHDATVVHDVHEIRYDVRQEPLIVRDHQDAELRTAEGVYAVGDDPQRVDVEARV